MEAFELFFFELMFMGPLAPGGVGFLVFGVFSLDIDVCGDPCAAAGQQGFSYVGAELGFLVVVEIDEEAFVDDG